MSLNVIKKVIDLGDGRTIEIETGKLAKQADGSVVIKMGDTMLLATVVSSPEAKEGVDFLPLSVDYQEKYAATGRIPGGFLRREARLSDYEVLISRLVDRALRPLFPEDYHADTQVMISLISADKDIMPDALAGLAASAALSVSDIPFNGPISEVRVAKIDGQLVINPTLSQLENATLEFIVAGSEHDINMVEGESKEIQEAELVEAIKFAHTAIKLQCLAQKELTIEVGKTEKRVYSHEHSNEDLKKAIYAATYDQVYSIASAASAKEERSAKFKEVRDAYIETLGEIDDITKSLAKKYYHDVEYDAIRNLVLDEGKRLDGRTTTQIRPIWSEVGYLPSAHGSAIFTRGETQSLTTVTLGAKDDEQMIDGAFINGYQKFLLHYNFPGFSTGEVRPNRGAGRREIGHGNLAMRSLKQVLPSEDENPYTIRVVSDILESNGSSSMATVCAGTLALMDAGVKIKEPVSGIAMGLITNEMGTKYAILSDILGDEDHLGDMDFKVTGTKNGIVAVQMDLKINGLSYEVLTNALNQAKDGRLHILGEMAKTITEARADYKPHAPRIVTIKIDKEFIGAVIGPGGKIIQEMQRETGATISIEEKDNQGIVQVFADNKASIDAALGRIRAIASKPEVGEIYEGKVKSIMPFGAFVEIMPGKDGLLHISEIDHRRIETMDGIFQIGDEVRVKLLDVDKQGKLKLSRKVLLPKPEPKQNN
ncbi:polyribonucleotide nucleotidyltransferase [Mucilaginibacter rubeus]|uniref:Polyribonucleotide nucleotidyltransferase n=1 Tax=Mucilaginibacter rubeus TaxID=2027860 RepID=A0AAE6JF61_9SPHI|nr:MULTISPECIES: polyribonucleotide nucleotidyltransferase [Mucilaginibacter]QEM04436.1 polyribonucleotide nucleotidyltransferase [Mucilaginibacter rubeus]QEM17032.1 polyribonucleotide nucleotidyltransferase [Mucilaginibacter gossypii]QTE46471.1 polyribonucleotide nucleotidyltransferase [Mucilaginibacter rubeus]QTE53068.1 polyribonucleotide nucleotidyltransferase [Mucilaginibacter rubeus]QTE58155.1 polyribonucleotide nucleotidyltransferase [Mucilaginibacter rubeus]